MTTYKIGYLLLFVSLAATALPSAGLAQTDTQKRQAKEHDEKATRYYDLQKWGEAIAEYEAAFLLVEDAGFLFNIGQAYRMWGKPEEAIRSYKNYLRRRPNAENRADVQKKIDDLEQLVEERRRGVAPGLDRGTVSGPAPVQGTAAPASAPPPPAPQKLPLTPSPSESSLGGLPPPPDGSSLQPQTTMPPPGSIGIGSQAPSSTPPVPLEEKTPLQPQPSKFRRLLPYGLLGLGGAGLLTAAVAGMVGAQKADKLAEASKRGEIYDPAVFENGKSANSAAALSALIGIAAGGAGIYLYLHDAKKNSLQATLSPHVGPTFAGSMIQVTY